MNYRLTIIASLEGKTIGECHKAVEILASIPGVTLEESSFKPSDAVTFVTERRKTKAYSLDPRMAYKTGVKTRQIDIEKTLSNLRLSKDQIINGDWKKDGTEWRVQRAIQRSAAKAA